MGEPTRDIAAERVEIDANIAGQTVPSLFRDVAAKHANEDALKWRTSDGWQALTWAQYREQVRDATLGLLQLGFQPGDFGLIMAANRAEHLIADLAIAHAAGAAVSIYNTLAPEQIAYIAGHCGGTVAFLENRTYLEKFLAIRDQIPNLRHVVLMEDDADDTSGWVMSWQKLLENGRRVASIYPGAFDVSWQRVRPDDIIALIYTSGTTGTPKGVIYTHYNILWTCDSTGRVPPGYQPHERELSYLPLAHIAERFTTHWNAIYIAATNHLVPDTTQLLPSLLEVRPTVFVGVPRVWEKFQAGIQLGIAAEQDEQRKAMLQAALAASRQKVELELHGEPVPPELAAKVEALAPVLTAIRGKIGLDQCHIAYTSTAPTPIDVLVFFASIGLPLVEVWGMSELTGPATANLPEHYKLGTAGPTLPGVEAKVAEDGELLVRGGNLMPGYYRDPARTADAIDSEGWLHTGDVVVVDDDDYYRIVDRKKELIITSSGKNISPANIEALLKSNPLVGQAIAVGDGHSYLTALIVLDPEVAPAWARAHGISAASPAELSAHPDVVDAVRRGVEQANGHLSRIEQIKRFTILPTEWTAESEELTPTLKLKRRVVQRKYASEVEGMYAADPTGYEVTTLVAAEAPMAAG
ncbi:MAG TPA: long-chain fatty acid--CoA ligase [Ktedonobacterales bacterium]|nr:long-chain fatty acid--CoA ligase [Ktedonobacterales bacterium]